MGVSSSRRRSNTSANPSLPPPLTRSVSQEAQSDEEVIEFRQGLFPPVPPHGPNATLMLINTTHPDELAPVLPPPDNKMSQKPEPSVRVCSRADQGIEIKLAATKDDNTGSLLPTVRDVLSDGFRYALGPQNIHE